MTSIKKLEAEGDIAADYLEEFLDIIDVDGDIEIDIKHDRPSVDIVAEGDELDKLVGAQGEVLEALQDLARLAIAAKTGDRSRLMVDIAGHRAAQISELTKTAQAACKRVNASGRPEDLEPMNSFERKVVHDVIAATGLSSESHGSDPYRYVTISVLESSISPNADEEDENVSRETFEGYEDEVPDLIA
jgi:spoIIIJ-associated protein